MRKLSILFALLFVLSVSVVSAQDAKSKKENFSWSKKIMTEAGIDEALQAKIDMAKKQNDEEVKAVKENTALSEDEKKKQLRELGKKRQTVIIEMLSPEQKVKIDEIKAAIKLKNDAIK